jgi:hypothetical protein
VSLVGVQFGSHVIPANPLSNPLDSPNMRLLREIPDFENLHNFLSEELTAEASKVDFFLQK